MLAVAVPATAKKTALRLPSVAQQSGVPIEHPAKIDAVVDLIGEPRDLSILEILARGQHSAEQQRSIDRRDLGVPYTLARVGIHEVIEPALLLERVVREVVECIQHALPEPLAIHPASVRGDAERRQPKSGGGTRGDSARVRGVAVDCPI